MYGESGVDFPRRVVCLTAETAEIAFMLGAGDRVVGVTGTARRPEAAREKARVGGFTTFKLDRILALEPDLVLAFSDLQRDVVRDLIGAGVAVLCTNQRSFEDVLGAILLLAGDVRVGAEGDFKIGLNEVAIGMPVPVFGTELARDRLSRRHFTRAVSTAAIYDSAGAVEAGYLDEVVAPDQVIEVATQHARALAQQLDPTAFRSTRVNARAATVRYIRDTLDADLGGFAITGS